MRIRKGNLEDLGQFEYVLKQAATRIKAIGSSQWGHILKGEERAIIAARLAQEEAYLYEEIVAGNPQVVSVFYLYERPNDWDFSLWSEEEQAGVYYLHRLSLADGYTGKGLAIQLLHELQAAVKQAGGRGIRLDCISTQPVLNRLYSSSGFELVKEIKDLMAGDVVADFHLYEWQV